MNHKQARGYKTHIKLRVDKWYYMSKQGLDRWGKSKRKIRPLVFKNFYFTYNNGRIVSVLDIANRKSLADFIYQHLGEGTYTVCGWGTHKNKKFRKTFECLGVSCPYHPLNPSGKKTCRVHKRFRTGWACAMNPRQKHNWVARARLTIKDVGDNQSITYHMCRMHLYKWFWKDGK